MTTAGAVALLVVGAILKFAVTASGSVYGVNLQIVGIILMLGGAIGLLLPLRAAVSRVNRRDDSDRQDDGGSPRSRSEEDYQHQYPADPDASRRTGRYDS